MLIFLLFYKITIAKISKFLKNKSKILNGDSFWHDFYLIIIVKDLKKIVIFAKL